MSSFFGSTTAVPPPPPKLAGQDASRTSTNEQAVALRYFAGIQRFALTWLGPAYNQKTKEVKSDGAGGGKGGGGAQTNGHDYFADVAGLACLGPVDRIFEIWMDQEKVWAGSVARTGDSAELDIEGKGHVTIYWGTETQTAQTVLAGKGHPPYRGQCYLFFHQLYFGRDKTNAPNIEVVLMRHPEIDGLETPPSWDSDVNPAHAMVELLTHPRFGLGWDAESTLDLALWDDAAAYLAGEQFGISPVLDRAQTARAVMVRFCEYFDGYLVAGAGGKLGLRLARPHGSPDDLPLLGEYDLLETPDPAPMAWRQTTNEVAVKFIDRDNKFQADIEPWRDLANLRVVGGEALTLNLDRPWFTRRYQAQKAAAWAGRIRSAPWVSSTSVVRKEAADGIMPGSFVRLTYEDYQETLVMRVLRRRVHDAKSQAVEFQLRADGYYNDLLPYTPDRPPLPDLPQIEPQPAAFARVLELPRPLVPAGSDPDRPQLAALVARASTFDVKFRVYSSEDDLTYEQAEHSRLFVVFGTLAADLPLTNTLDDSAGGMLLELVGTDDALDLESTGERGRQKARLLVFVGDEIISYRQATVVGGGARLVGLRRACFDTLMAVHPAGTPVAIIRRKALRPFTDETYETGDAVNFKVATATAEATLDLADADAQEVVLVNRSAQPMAPINLRVNGAGFGCTYAAGGDLVVEWDAASWRRHKFWESWEDAFSDDRLRYRVRVFSDAGTKLKTFRSGANTSYTITSAMLRSLFGGSDPAALRVRVFVVRRGHRSVGGLEQRVTKL